MIMKKLKSVKNWNGIGSHFENSTGTMRVYVDEDGSMQLFSYAAMVISVDKDGWAYCTGLYSHTTRDHIRAFARDFTHLTFADFRDALYDHYVNIFTGATREYAAA